MPLYRLLTRETREREMVVEARSLHEARLSRPAQWDDCGDPGVVVDWSIEDVDGPPADEGQEPCALSAWREREQQEKGR